VGSSSASPQTTEESESRSPTLSDINRLSGSVCTEAKPDDGDWKVDPKLTPAASPSVQDTLVIATAMAVSGTEGKYDFVLAVAGTEGKNDLKARQERDELSDLMSITQSETKHAIDDDFDVKHVQHTNTEGPDVTSGKADFEHKIQQDIDQIFELCSEAETFAQCDVLTGISTRVCVCGGVCVCVCVCEKRERECVCVCH